MNQQALTAAKAQRLGIDTSQTGAAGVYASQALHVLGPHSFVEFKAVRAPGKVIWCNFELARQLGFQVPRSNQMTPAFHEELLAALSFRAVSADSVADQESITMYADRYGGDGVLPALGAGRSGFLSYGNLYVKGVGFTPLFKHDDPDDFAHSHGEVHLDDCLAEAIFGEVNENLFSQGSTRILAIIDQGKHVTTPKSRRIPVALAVRAGAQLRPAHLLGNIVRRRGYLLEQFVNMTRATGQLVTCIDQETGAQLPDVGATMLRVIDDHARTSAEAFRWRMIHGALSSSNMELSGAMLDLPTQSTQPRTAPIRSLDYALSVFGTEHLERASKLMTVYRTLLRNATLAERARFNVVSIGGAAAMKASYNRHLQGQLLRAAGLKAIVAQRVQEQRPAVASQFAELILRMVALKNPGTIRVWQSVVPNVSVLDVFNLLQQLPANYFANPNADQTTFIMEALRPVFRGKRSQIVEKQTAVSALAGEFATAYRDLMTTCTDFAGEYYDDLASMQDSIIARAKFENQPLSALYCQTLLRELKRTITNYRTTGAAELISEAIDWRINSSLRSCEGLLAQGSARRLGGGGVELQMRTINGINYSVKAWNDAAQRRRLHVSISLERSGDHYTSPLPHLPRLTKLQIQSLRCRFTTDEGRTFAETRGRLRRDEQLGLLIDFDDLDSSSRVGQLAVVFYLHSNARARAKESTPYFRGYSFAIPDRQELISCFQSPTMSARRSKRRDRMASRPSPIDNPAQTA